MSQYLDDVRGALLGRAPGILYDWLPGGRAMGAYYKCASISGGNGDSLSVNLKTGQWGDFAGPSDHHGGDLISLYAKVKGVEYKDALRTLADELAIAPETRTRTRSNDWQSVCPAPSSSYKSSETGYPERPNIAGLENVTDRWIYYDADGNVMMFVARVEVAGQRKSFRPITLWRHRKTGVLEWRTQALPAPRPLYNLLGLSAEPEKVLVTEGEKAADAAADLLPDWCVITWPGGAQNVAHADWEPLRKLVGARIVLWPDHDPPGVQAMSEVQRQLGRDLEAVMPDPSWPAGYDIADLKNDNWTPERLAAWIAGHAAKVLAPAHEERVEFRLDGADQNEHMVAVFDAIAKSRAQIFSTGSGVGRVCKTIYGAPSIETMDAETFAAALVPYIAPKRQQAHGVTDWKISPELAGIVLTNSNGHFPPLEHSYATPIFLPGGKLVDKRGYSREARAWVEPPEGYDPEMSISEALGLWDDLVRDFPFEADSDRTAALAFTLTPILRPAIDGPTPLFRFEAPQPRTGKTLLCTALSEIVSPSIGLGRLSTDEEEARKQITTLLMRGEVIHIFDNAERIEASALKSVLTATNWKDRILGQNREVSVPIRTVFAVTLNNPVMSLEILGRSVRIRLNAGVEAPEKRSGWARPDLRSYVRKNRGKLVSALVAMVREAADFKPGKVPVLGSYEDWIAVLAPVLEANGFPDFLGSLEEDKEQSADPGQDAIRVFVQKWADEFRSDSVTARDLVEAASASVGFPAKKTDSGKVSADSVGRVLNRIRGSIVCGFLVQKHTRVGSGATVWSLHGDFAGREKQDSLGF